MKDAIRGWMQASLSSRFVAGRLLSDWAPECFGCSRERAERPEVRLMVRSRIGTIQISA